MTTCQIVNVRRPIVYVLLSLLLVLTQQMGFTHALSHWSASRAGGTTQAMAQVRAQALAQSGEDGGGKAQSFDQSCEQCLAFAQIGAPIDVQFSSFPVAGGSALAVTAAPVLAPCQRSVCVFHSRAPPVMA